MADLTSLSSFKQYENKTSSADDQQLSALITSVSQLVKTYCGRTFIDYYNTPLTQTFSITQPKTRHVLLRETPIVEIVSVEVDNGNGYEPFSDYYVDEFGILYNKAGFWPLGYGSVKVTYKGGYASTPPDLLLAVNDLVVFYWKDEHKINRSLGSASVSNSVGSGATGTVSFPDHIRRVLNLYKENV